MSRGLLKKLLFCGATTFQKYNIPNFVEHTSTKFDDQEQMKFELDANYLNHPLFQDLLNLSKEETGYSYGGALRIACEIDLFLHLLHLLKSSNPSVHYMQLHHVMAYYYANKFKKYLHSHDLQLISAN